MFFICRVIVGKIDDHARREMMSFYWWTGDLQKGRRTPGRGSTEATQGMRYVTQRPTDG